MKKKSITIDVESEEERFLKALAKCRNCSHVKMAHSFLYAKGGMCIDANIQKDGTYSQCSCITYAPADNLKYLEWLHENKQKRKKKQKDVR